MGAARYNLIIRRRAPRSINTSIEKLVQQVRPNSALTNVQAVWEEIVGPQIHSVTKLIRVRNGELLVQCESSLWANEISLLSAQIILKINRFIPTNESIQKIRCTITSEPH